MSHKRVNSFGSSGRKLNLYSLPSVHLGKTKLRYIFTAQDIRLSCGSAVLTPANAASVPAVSLVWRSGSKQALGGVARAIPNGSEGNEKGANQARWETPVSLKCSIYKSGQRSEPRLSEFVVKIEGVQTPRKLTGSLDLASHASYDRTSTKVTVPLSHGAGQLHLTLVSVWLKNSQLDDAEEDSETASQSSFRSDATDREMMFINRKVNEKAQHEQSSARAGPPAAAQSPRAMPSAPAAAPAMAAPAVGTLYMQRRGTAGEEKLRPFPSSENGDGSGAGGGSSSGGAAASDGVARVGGLNGDGATTPPAQATPPNLLARELSFTQQRKHRQAASCHYTPGSSQADTNMCTRAAARLPADRLASVHAHGHARSASHGQTRAAGHAGLGLAAANGAAAARRGVAKASMCRRIKHPHNILRRLSGPAAHARTQSAARCAHVRPAGPSDARHSLFVYSGG